MRMQIRPHKQATCAQKLAVERARSGEIGMRPSERRRMAEAQAAQGGMAPGGGGGGYPDNFGGGGRGGGRGGYDYGGGGGRGAFGYALSHCGPARGARHSCLGPVCG